LPNEKKYLYLRSKIKHAENMKKKSTEKLSDFLIDIAKLVFGGVVLSVILDLEINKIVVLLTGMFTTAVLALFGFILYNKK
jgi:hypothetical protein